MTKAAMEQGGPMNLVLAAAVAGAGLWLWSRRKGDGAERAGADPLGAGGFLHGPEFGFRGARSRRVRGYRRGR